MTAMPTKLLAFAVAVNAVPGQIPLEFALSTLGRGPSFDAIPRFLSQALASRWMYASLTVQALGYFLWMVLIAIGVACVSLNLL